ARAWASTADPRATFASTSATATSTWTSPPGRSSATVSWSRSSESSLSIDAHSRSRRSRRPGSAGKPSHAAVRPAHPARGESGGRRPRGRAARRAIWRSRFRAATGTSIRSSSGRVRGTRRRSGWLLAGDVGGDREPAAVAAGPDVRIASGARAPLGRRERRPRVDDREIAAHQPDVDVVGLEVRELEGLGDLGQERRAVHEAPVRQRADEVDGEDLPEELDVRGDHGTDVVLVELAENGEGGHRGARWSHGILLPGGDVRPRPAPSRRARIGEGSGHEGEPVLRRSVRRRRPLATAAPRRTRATGATPPTDARAPV